MTCRWGSRTVTSTPLGWGSAVGKAMCVWGGVSGGWWKLPVLSAPFGILNLFKNITSVKKKRKKMPSRPQQHSDGRSTDQDTRRRFPGTLAAPPFRVGVIWKPGRQRAPRSQTSSFQSYETMNVVLEPHRLWHVAVAGWAAQDRCYLPGPWSPR